MAFADKPALPCRLPISFLIPLQRKDHEARLHLRAQHLGLLQSALGRPHQHYAYGAPDIVELAAIYTAGLVRDRPFADGNKRMGLAVGVALLELNGFAFPATEEDATQTVLALAAGDLDEASYTVWLRANVKRRKSNRPVR